MQKDWINSSFTIIPYNLAKDKYKFCYHLDLYSSFLVNIHEKSRKCFWSIYGKFKPLKL